MYLHDKLFDVFTEKLGIVHFLIAHVPEQLVLVGTLEG